MNYRLRVAIENFNPLNQQQRESKEVIVAEITQLETKIEQLLAHIKATDYQRSN